MIANKSFLVLLTCIVLQVRGPMEIANVSH